jgi:hypothetical protein
LIVISALSVVWSFFQIKHFWTFLDISLFPVNRRKRVKGSTKLGPIEEKGFVDLTGDITSQTK